MTRPKIPSNVPRNPFVEGYRTNFPNVYAEAIRSNERASSMSPRNTSNSPSHPRQISGTYSAENSEGLPFPYNVVPPPRSKLDSRTQQPSKTTPPITAQQQRLNLQRQMQRAKTPEILLAPHYLDNSRIYYDWGAREPAYRMQNANKRHQHHVVSSGDENLDDNDENGQRVPSDIDSQVGNPW